MLIIGYQFFSKICILLMKVNKSFGVKQLSYIWAIAILFFSKCFRDGFFANKKLIITLRTSKFGDVA